MSLNGPTIHDSTIDLCIIFQCKIYTSIIMSCENNLVTCIMFYMPFLSCAHAQPSHAKRNGGATYGRRVTDKGDWSQTWVTGHRHW